MREIEDRLDQLDSQLGSIEKSLRSIGSFCENATIMFWVLVIGLVLRAFGDTIWGFFKGVGLIIVAIPVIGWHFATHPPEWLSGIFWIAVAVSIVGGIMHQLFPNPKTPRYFWWLRNLTTKGYRFLTKNK